MSSEGKPLRADAVRNRARVLEAAEALFGERGLDVGVGEIAERAGVGRGTVFRNFPTKEHLIAAVVVERMHGALARARALAESPDSDPARPALFEFLEDLVGRHQLDRALFEAVDDEFLANDDIRSAYAELTASGDRLLRRAQDAGAVRADVGVLDVLMLVKGVCQAAAALRQIDPEMADRQFDLVRAALTAEADAAPLRGRTPTLEDVERAFAPAEAKSSAHRRVDRDGGEQQRQVQQRVME